MNKTLQLLSLQVSKHLRCFRLFLLTLLLCGYMQTMAETWTDGNGLTWSFTVNGTEATDIKLSGGPNSEKIYLYGDPNRSEEEKAKDPQLPFVPGAWNAADMRFSSTEGAHLPTIPDEVYFSLKTLIFDVSDVTDDFDLKVMNGWWSNTYYDHVKWVDGLNELQITQTMADECAKGGRGRDLNLMLYSGSMTLKAVYYESVVVSGAVVIPEKVYAGSTELIVTSIANRAFSGSSGLTSVTIPSSVTSISGYAFYGCDRLTSISVENGNSVYDSRNNCNAIIETATNTLIAGCKNTIIPSSVTRIGNGAFGYCSGLTSVTIPEGVTSIGNEAFLYCSGLTSVTIPEGVTSIGNGAFGYCSGLTSVTIPKGVTSIGDRVFAYCFSLTSATIPEGVTSIDNEAFQYCYRLTSVTIPEGVMSIGNGAFQYCDRLTSVVIPSSVTSIGNNAFYRSGLKSINIPNSVTVIGSAAFADCDLTSVTIPNSVTSIGNRAFNYCNGLTSVTIPNSVTKIGEYAFEGCSGLTSVTIPHSVTSIGAEAFSECPSLDEVKSLIEEPFEISKNTFSFIIYGYEKNQISYPATLYVPAGTKEKYENTPGWNVFTNIVEMDIAPVDEGQTVDFGTEINESTNIDGSVVGNIFYSINSGDGSYNPIEGCIVLTKPANEFAIDLYDIFSESFNEQFNGIVFKVNEGKGCVKVEAETQGNMVLKVKIGNSEPIEMELDGKLKVKFPYNVSEPTYVYIYGGMGAAGAKAMGANRAKSAADLLKIYGFEIVSDPSGIDAIENGQQADAPVYNLNGQRVNTLGKGIYIKNGRKVLMK